MEEKILKTLIIYWRLLGLHSVLFKAGDVEGLCVKVTVVLNGGRGSACAKPA